MSLIDHDNAAHEAGQRASSCRARLQRLQSREPVTSDDAARAKEALRVATVRALAASVRSGAQGSGRDSARPAWLHIDDSSGQLSALLAAGTVQLPELIVAYVGLGGSCGDFDIDGYLNGIFCLPRLEATLLDEAASELS